MRWNDYLVIAAQVCILTGTGLSLVDEDTVDDPAACKLFSAILLNAAVVMVAVAWYSRAL